MLQVKRLHPDARLPTRGHPTDAGLDLYALEDVSPSLAPVVQARTGLALAIPEGYVGLVCDRSSKGRAGLKVMGGVIDPGYTGEVFVPLGVFKRWWQWWTPRIHRGDRIAQLLVLPVAMLDPVEVDDLPVSQRGTNGFGSTGR